MINAPLLTLRDYQSQAIDSLWEYFREKPGNPLILMPGGTGKATVIAGIVARGLSEYPRFRAVMGTHVQELVDNNAKTMRRYLPTVPLGVCSAGLKRKDFIHPVLFGGIGTMVNMVDKIGHVDVFICDEAHRIGTKNEAQYLTFINGLKAINPNLRVVGLTATGYRAGLGPLTNGHIFTDVAVDMTSIDWWNWFVANGYLVAPTTISTNTKLDVSSVSIVNGEYNQTELEQAVDKDDINQAIVAEIMWRAADRRKWLTFASGIEHAEHLAELFNRSGVPTIAVHSKLPQKQREAAFADYRSGRVRCLTNKDLISTGNDIPEIDTIAMAAPTRIATLHVQRICRGTRPAPGKKSLLVIDFAQNISRLGPVNDPVWPKRKGEKTGDAPIKICPDCGVYNHASARYCDACGYKFEFQSHITATAKEGEVFRGDMPVIEVWDVLRVSYASHTKRTTGARSIRVDYFCGTSQGPKGIAEWINFDGTASFGKHKTHQWWLQRVGDNLPPDNENALNYLGQNGSAILRPRQLRVWTNRQYPEIVNHIF